MVLAICMVVLVASAPPAHWFDLLPCYGYILAALLMVQGAKSRLGHATIVLTLGVAFFLLYTFKLQIPEYLLRYFTRPGLIAGRGVVIYETVALGILAFLMQKDFKIPYGIWKMDGNKQAMFVLAVHCIASLIVRETCGKAEFYAFFLLFSIPAVYGMLFVGLAGPRFISAFGMTIVGVSIAGIFMTLNPVAALPDHQIILTAMMVCTVLFAAILYLFRLPTTEEESASARESIGDLLLTDPSDEVSPPVS